MAFTRAAELGRKVEARGAMRRSLFELPIDATEMSAQIVLISRLAAFARDSQGHQRFEGQRDLVRIN